MSRSRHGLIFPFFQDDPAANLATHGAGRVSGGKRRGGYTNLKQTNKPGLDRRWGTVHEHSPFIALDPV